MKISLDIMQVQDFESTQADIDTFLGHNTHIMRAYYTEFLKENSESIQHGWEGIYLSLQVQVQRTCGWSIDPTLTPAQREESRRKAHMIIMDLCHVANFFKHKIPKEDLVKILRLLYSLRFQHPIGEALVEADLVFKDNVVRAIYTLGNHLRNI